MQSQTSHDTNLLSTSRLLECWRWRSSKRPTHPIYWTRHTETINCQTIDCLLHHMSLPLIGPFFVNLCYIICRDGSYGVGVLYVVSYFITYISVFFKLLRIIRFWALNEFCSHKPPRAPQKHSQALKSPTEALPSPQRNSPPLRT